MEVGVSCSTPSMAASRPTLATGINAEIEEERRLLYVAMTRAKDQLHLMVPQRFFTHGQRSPATAMSMPSARALSRTA